MILVELVTLALVIDAISAVSLLNCFDKNITWIGGELLDVCGNDNMISKNIWATRVAIHGAHAFLAIPRYKSGVPITLAKMSLERPRHVQTPYPSWEMQKQGDCAVLQSVIDVFLDSRGILWALDAGAVDYFQYPNYHCQPKIVGINVETGKVEKTIPIEMKDSRSMLQYIVVDYSPEGRPFVYVSELGVEPEYIRVLLVFDVFNKKNYRVQLPYVRDAHMPEFIGINLLQTDNGNYLLINYQFENGHMFYAKTSLLQCGSAADMIVDLGSTGWSVILGTDDASSIFFRKYKESNIYRYDMMRPDSPVTLVYKGNSSGNPWMLATHVVLDNKRGGIGVLESDNTDYIDDCSETLGVPHSLILTNSWVEPTSEFLMKKVADVLKKLNHMVKNIKNE